MKFCPECGHQRNHGLFCGECGFKFPQPKESACPDCGKERLDGSFCGDCGYRFTTPLDPTQKGKGSASLGLGIEYPKKSDKERELSSRLKYGKGYDKELNCYNCGEPKTKTRRTCKLCEADLSSN